MHGARGQAIEGDRTKGWDHGISGSTRAMGGDKGAPISGSSDTHTHTERVSARGGRLRRQDGLAMQRERERGRAGAGKGVSRVGRKAEREGAAGYFSSFLLF